MSKRKDRGQGNGTKVARTETMMEENYHSQKYWNDRYQTADGYHEWYFDFDCIEPIFSEHVTSRDAVILELGCGDAPLITAMQQNHNPACLHAIDFSDTIIAKLNNEQASVPISKRVSFTVEDARNLSFGDNTYDIIIEKGTIDAMLCDKRKGFANVKSIMKEACRLMKKDVPTAFMMMSHMQAESAEFASFIERSFLPALEECKSTNRWVIEAHTQAASTHAVVYIISSLPRRVTRSATQPFTTVSVDVQIHSHSADSDDE